MSCISSSINRNVSYQWGKNFHSLITKILAPKFAGPHDIHSSFSRAASISYAPLGNVQSYELIRFRLSRVLLALGLLLRLRGESQSRPRTEILVGVLELGHFSTYIDSLCLTCQDLASTGQYARQLDRLPLQFLGPWLSEFITSALNPTLPHHCF